MTLDQCSKLHKLAEKLCDIALEEANPDHWPGAGKKAHELTQKERGDRFWSKKNAAATLNLTTNISQLVGVERLIADGVDANPTYSPEDIQRFIDDAEREVRRIARGRPTDKGNKSN